jgi:hypothetical protein
MRSSRSSCACSLARWEEVDLNGVSRTSLLKIVGGVDFRLVRSAKSAAQTSSSDACPEIHSNRRVNDLPSKSLDSMWATRLKRSRKRVPEPLWEGRVRASGVVCRARARTSSSARSLVSNSVSDYLL